MKRRSLLLGGLSLPLAYALPAVAALPSVRVYKSPSCGCCGAWIEHLRSAGFEVGATDVADTAAVRARFGLAAKYGSCHTATVAGYVLEGHVPAEDVKRLLVARPDALGLAVPGMPIGSPGMEAGARVEPYDVLLVDRAGGATVFRRYPKT